MTRRRLLVALGAAALVVPLASFAQHVKKSAVVGVLRHGERVRSQACIAAFRQSLETLGYVEGKNLILQLRFADGKVERLTALAAALCSPTQTRRRNHD